MQVVLCIHACIHTNIHNITLFHRLGKIPYVYETVGGGGGVVLSPT